jgi:hypothetical protein
MPIEVLIDPTSLQSAQSATLSTLPPMLLVEGKEAGGLLGREGQEKVAHASAEALYGLKAPSSATDDLVTSQSQEQA